MKDSVILQIKDPKRTARKRVPFENPAKDALYNWYAVNTGLLAPIGWHIPSQAEWDELRIYVTLTKSGGELKEIGTTHWLTPNEGATDNYGFKGIGAGYRYYTDGAFYGLKEWGGWWTSTNSGGEANAVHFEYNNDESWYGIRNYKDGLSVRAIKDTSEWEEGETITDIDGNKYQTVKIGNQVWMAENLRTTKYNDGASIPEEKDNEVWTALTTGARCYYDSTIPVEETASVDSTTLTWEEYEITEKYFKVTTSLQRWYFGTDSLYTGFTRKVYNTDGETEITDGVYHDGYYVGLTPVDENVRGAERHFSIEIADWKNQTLAMATGTQPPGAGTEAGPDQRIHGTLGAFMAAVPSRGTGTWTLVTGMGTVTFYYVHSATTEIRVFAYGQYTLKWTEVWGGGSDNDQVTFEFIP